MLDSITVKTVLSDHSKRTQNFCFQYQISLNASQKYCRMLQREHSAILLTFIKLPFSIKTFVLSIFKWQFKTGVTVSCDFELIFKYHFWCGKRQDLTIYMALKWASFHDANKFCNSRVVIQFYTFCFSLCVTC